MTAPDYSSYTHAQLQQVLGHIDAQRYPERVQEITARLAVPEQLPDAVAAAAPSGLAPVWRRIAAFVIDMLLLAVVGLIAGSVLHAQFAAMGLWGLMVGFVIAVTYFGLTQSRLRDGQSVGMLLMHIRVVQRSGQAPGVPAAFLLAGIVCLAYFLNGTWISVPAQHQWLSIALAVVVFSLLLSVPYLVLFNRRTRQSLHDLAIGAYVVRAGTALPELPQARLWRGHLAVIAVVVLLCGGVAIAVSGKFFPGQATGEAVASVLALQQKLAAVPGVERVGVQMQSMRGTDGQHARYFVVRGVIDQATPDPAAIARRLTQTVLDNNAEAAHQDALIVTLFWGYDIGIARSWQATQFAETPEKWRELLAAPPALAD